MPHDGVQTFEPARVILAMDIDDAMTDVLPESCQRFLRCAVAIEALKILCVEETRAPITEMLAVIGMQEDFVRRLNFDS